MIVGPEEDHDAHLPAACPMTSQVQKDFRNSERKIQCEANEKHILEQLPNLAVHDIVWDQRDLGHLVPRGITTTSLKL
eukprot:scaffold37903_cov16-Prasinocladus_malaysianus.AAC.1